MSNVKYKLKEVRTGCNENKQKKSKTIVCSFTTVV